MSKSKLTAADMAARAAQLAHTLTVEQWDTLPTETEIKLKALKSWGLDLLAGEKNGEATWFVAEADRRKAGDRYEADGHQYAVTEVLSQLPKNLRLTLLITSEDHEARVEGLLWDDAAQRSVSLFKLPAAEVLLAMAKKHELGQLLAHLHSVGITSEVLKKHGESGKTVAFENLPPEPRRALREAKKILRKHVPAGRFELSYFGENKDGKARYQASFILPTLSLLDIQVANKVDKLFAELNP